jgi:arylsulfatase A-like enzyme
MTLGRLSPVLGAIATMMVVPAALAQTVVPKPEAPFRGVMNRDVRKSTPSWPEEVHPPKGAPNVLLILVDDVGFSTTSTFGGPVPTPNFDKLAENGLRYNEFHVNAICAPSRAALLSGRNNHEVGFGTIGEHAQGYPGYNSIWPKSSAGIAKVMVESGYNTAAFGKWHNTPVWEVSPSGPFDRWPTGEGFEYFYGFLSAFDNQYVPRLYRDTTPVEPSKTEAEGYSLTDDMTDDAIRWLHLHDATSSGKPFFMYFATAATHTPHQVPQRWITPFKGKFDEGWDKLRAENFEREKKLGVIPANAENTPRPEGLAAWDSLPPVEQKLLAHQAEVYAGFTAQADYDIGRVIQTLRDEGQLDNTLVIEIFGDNGGCAEDGPTGYDMRQINGQMSSIQEREKHDDDLGSEVYMNAAAAPWAWAFSTPFKGTKADAAHLGGTRDPLVISWPTRLQKEDGGLRSQFSHLVDVAPTIFEAAGIKPPTSVDGVPQTKLEGNSLLYTFDSPSAPSRHHIQYFETNGNLAIYKDGWWAGKLLRNSWDRIGSDGYSRDQLLDGNTHPWELYNLNDDFSQAHDLAKKDPEKLKQMEALFDEEAKRNHVYPLLPLRELINRPANNNNKTSFTFRSGVNRLQDVMNPLMGAGTGYTIRADIDNPSGSASGVIMAQGSRYGGITLFVKNKHVYFEVNSSGALSGKLVSSSELPTGHSVITVDITPDQASAGAVDKKNGQSPFPGHGRMTINGKQSAETSFINLPATGGYWSPAETLDVGSDLGSPVSSEYASPNNFTGLIDTVKLDLHPSTYGADATEKAARNDGHS